MTTTKKAAPTKMATPAVAKRAAAKKGVAKKPVATTAGGTKSSVKTPAKKAAATKKARSAEEKYTDPELREHIKDDVMAGDKGGRAGQWSARKAQMVAHEYEAEGGGYKGGKDETQKSLTAWGEEHWTTSDGKPAEREDGMHRYLPEKAWEELSPEEKKATDRKKLAGDHEGKQFVANTGAAVKARKSAEK
jgi:hypothetical protein